MEKGAEVIRTLFLFSISIISICADSPDTISNFIFFADSLGWAENRQNRGLTRFFANKKAVAVFEVVACTGCGKSRLSTASP
jgi:hypothetical protein